MSMIYLFKTHPLLKARHSNFIVPAALQKFATFLSSPEYNPNLKIEYEASKNPNEWKYVERVLPSKLIPQPTDKPLYPSGWKPQSVDALNQPYFIRRTRNYLIPVYLDICERGLRRTTSIKHIEGDISLLENDLRKYLMLKCGKDVGIKVDEINGKLALRGDYVNHILKWIDSKGF